MTTDKPRVVAYVDSEMVSDADDVPSHEDGRTLYVPALTEGEGTPGEELGPEYAALDATSFGSGERPRAWALFDREATTAEKAAALAEYVA